MEHRGISATTGQLCFPALPSCFFDFPVGMWRFWAARASDPAPALILYHVGLRLNVFGCFAQAGMGVTMVRYLVLIVIALLGSASVATAADEVAARKACTEKWRSMSSSEKGPARFDDFAYKCIQASAAESPGDSTFIGGRRDARAPAAIRLSPSRSLFPKAVVSGIRH